MIFELIGGSQRKANTVLNGRGYGDKERSGIDASGVIFDLIKFNSSSLQKMVIDSSRNRPKKSVDWSFVRFEP